MNITFTLLIAAALTYIFYCIYRDCTRLLDMAIEDWKERRQ